MDSKISTGKISTGRISTGGTSSLPNKPNGIPHPPRHDPPRHNHSEILNGYHRPKTPVEHLAARMREYLHMPNPEPLYAFMGAVAGNLLQGPPVWMMIVGPPGSGKSELLSSIRHMPWVEPASTITGESNFLSGTSKKDRATDATGGLLKMIQPHGAIVIGDFTGIMSLPPDKLREVLGVMTTVYDGYYDRPIGSDGGKVLKWRGRAAMFAGVTGQKMDEHHQITSALGQRWLFMRMEGGDGFAQLKQAQANTTNPGWQEEMQQTVHAFFEGLDLRFGELGERRPVLTPETVRLHRIAEVAAKCRSGVPRDWRNKEIIAYPEAEFVGRIGLELTQLYIGMDYIGVPDRERWRVTKQVALDSMPKLRRVVLDQVVRAGKDGVTMVEIMKRIMVKEAEGAARAMVDRAVVDLCVHGVLRKEKEGSQVRVLMTDWMAGEWERGFGDA